MGGCGAVGGSPLTKALYNRQEMNRRVDKPTEFRRNAQAVSALRDPQLQPLSRHLGAGRGIVRVGRGGKPLPRSVQRLGLQSAGALPHGGGRGRPRAVGPVDPRAQHLAHRTARPMGQGPFGAELRRSGVFLQLRHRSQRGGDQAGPAAHAQAALQDHHLRGRVSRPHARRHLGHRAAESITRGLDR